MNVPNNFISILLSFFGLIISNEVNSKKLKQTSKLPSKNIVLIIADDLGLIISKKNSFKYYFKGEKLFLTLRLVRPWICKWRGNNTKY